jgi:3'-phosphoadenosine 5'-phosphosulfate (PAPS) 3'-phosphatase
MPLLDQIRDVLVDAVLAGAAAILKVRGCCNLGVRIKSGRELVTAADEASDAAILSVFQLRLTALDPSISFYLEESGATAAASRK